MIHSTRKLFPILLVLVLVISFVPLQRAQAATIVVGGACTLAEAIQAAETDVATTNCPAGSAGADDIHLTGNVTAVPLPAYDIGHGPNALPPITTPITIHGHGFAITGAGGARIFEVSGAGGNLTLNNVAVQGGQAVSAANNDGVQSGPVATHLPSTA